MRFRLVLVGLEGAAGVFCQLPHVTSVSWPGLDFTGPTASVNVAAQAAGGVPFGSGSLQVACDRSGAGEGKDYGTGGHCLNNINDGLYGNVDVESWWQACHVLSWLRHIHHVFFGKHVGPV